MFVPQHFEDSRIEVSQLCEFLVHFLNSKYVPYELKSDFVVLAFCDIRYFKSFLITKNFMIHVDLRYI